MDSKQWRRNFEEFQLYPKECGRYLKSDRGIGTKSVGGFLVSVGVTYNFIVVTFKSVRGISKSIGGTSKNVEVFLFVGVVVTPGVDGLVYGMYLEGP